LASTRRSTEARRQQLTLRTGKASIFNRDHQRDSRGNLSDQNLQNDTPREKLTMKAWTFQDHRQKEKLGDDCPWSVGFLDPDGKRKSKRIGSKSAATKYQRKIEGQLAAGVYETVSRKGWDDFEAEYESKVMASMGAGTRESAEYAIKHFKRIVKPVRMAAINSKTIVDYVAARRLEKKFKREVSPLVSPATVNKELRTLRAILRKAKRWGYIANAPEFDFLREPGKLPTYVPPEDFAKLYASCDSTRRPHLQGCEPADWWRALLITGYMTGWRIGSLLSLRWEDIDTKAGTAISRYGDNKGKRDQKIPLHPLVFEHIAKLKGFSPLVFPWPHSAREIFREFNALQEAAGVKPEGGKARYGFHDLRRAFATMNAPNLTADALQHLMQHKDYQTTQRYINMARQLKPAVQTLYVPSLTVADVG
jgi:integrase